MVGARHRAGCIGLLCMGIGCSMLLGRAREQAIYYNFATHCLSQPTGNFCLLAFSLNVACMSHITWLRTRGAAAGLLRACCIAVGSPANVRLRACCAAACLLH